MASNFRILIHRSGDSIHLKLVGIFDGAAAQELVTVIKRSKGFGRIFVHTSGLREVLDFGRDVFQKAFMVASGSTDKLVFTGALGLQLAPVGCRTINE